MHSGDRETIPIDDFRELMRHQVYAIERRGQTLEVAQRPAEKANVLALNELDPGMCHTQSISKRKRYGRACRLSTSFDW